jgi:hypothetical protein
MIVKTANRAGALAKAGRLAGAEVIMAADATKEIQFEIGHVLFIDIVGYSKLSVNEQYARVAELNESVRLFEQLGDTAQN